MDTFDNYTRIFCIPQNTGDWGHILEATKEGGYYIIKGQYEFIYPACCVEEITPEWLEENADKFHEEVIHADYDTTHFITIYKAMNGLHTYFFYVKYVSYYGCEKDVEDFREIK